MNIEWKKGLLKSKIQKSFHYYIADSILILGQLCWNILGGKRVQTIHSFAMNLIVAIILGKEELEVSLWIFNRSDFIFLIDEVPENRLKYLLKLR